MWNMLAIRVSIPGQAPPSAWKIAKTNYFPWVNVFDVQKRYADIGFKDFRHAVTGVPLTKLQHPETETFWGSTHERAGVECKSCHMPRVKDKKGEDLHLPWAEECEIHAERHLRPVPQHLVPG